MKTDELLEILSPDPGDPIFTASLAKTLQAVRGRRRRQRTLRAAGLLVIVLSGLLFLKGRWLDDGPVPRPPTLVSSDAFAEPAEVILSEALPAGTWVETRPDLFVWIETSPEESVELLGDDELLSLAPGCIAITRLEGHAGVIVLCKDLLSLQ